MLIQRSSCASPLLGRHRHNFLMPNCLRYCSTQKDEKRQKEGTEDKDRREKQREEKGSRQFVMEKEQKPIALSLWKQALNVLGLSTYRTVPPTTMAFTHRKGGFDYVDIDVPMDVLIEEFPKTLREESKVAK